jgi:hypothetical protein
MCNGTVLTVLSFKPVGPRAAALRADAAAPAAPVGAHARARARNHEHRRKPLYIRHAVLREPGRHPMLPQLDEYAPPRAWGSMMRIAT